ncbi:MAG: SHOCT domain-containing protein [Acidimicrobiales bacterium]
MAGRVHHRQDQKWAADEQQAQAEQYYAAAPEAAAPADDMDQLQKLAALHTQGVLTDEEFAAKKAQILGL